MGKFNMFDIDKIILATIDGSDELSPVYVDNDEMYFIYQDHIVRSGIKVHLADFPENLPTFRALFVNNDFDLIAPKKVSQKELFKYIELFNSIDIGSEEDMLIRYSANTIGDVISRTVRKDMLKKNPISLISQEVDFDVLSEEMAERARISMYENGSYSMQSSNDEDFYNAEYDSATIYTGKPFKIEADKDNVKFNNRDVFIEEKSMARVRKQDLN